jgi:hypothetical protein
MTEISLAEILLVIQRAARDVRVIGAVFALVEDGRAAGHEAGIGNPPIRNDGEPGPERLYPADAGLRGTVE